tara:strand:- start:3796 stop:4995 length:1200 start_codon:yes stop_codon:yes gene_type:complete
MEETKVDMDQEKVNTMITRATNTVVRELNVTGRDISDKERFIGTLNKLKNDEDYSNLLLFLQKRYLLTEIGKQKALDDREKELDNIKEGHTPDVSKKHLLNIGLSFLYFKKPINDEIKGVLIDLRRIDAMFPNSHHSAHHRVLIVEKIIMADYLFDEIEKLIEDDSLSHKKNLENKKIFYESIKENSESTTYGYDWRRSIDEKFMFTFLGLSNDRLKTLNNRINEEGINIKKRQAVSDSIEKKSNYLPSLNNRCIMQKIMSKIRESKPEFEDFNLNSSNDDFIAALSKLTDDEIETAFIDCINSSNQKDLKKIGKSFDLGSLKGTNVELKKKIIDTFKENALELEEKKGEKVLSPELVGIINDFAIPPAGGRKQKGYTLRKRKHKKPLKIRYSSKKNSL